MKIKRKAYISLEVVFLLTIMVISGMYVTIKLFNKGHNVSGQEAEAFSKVNHTVNNAINVGSTGGGGSGGGGGGSTPSEPTGVIDTIYWGIDASGKLIISDVQVATALEGKSGSFAGTDTFDFDSAPPWARHSGDITSIKVERFNRRVAPASTAMWFAKLVNVTDIDVSNLDTSNVTNMFGTFGGCGMGATTLSIEGLETWNTSNVTNMAFMFINCGVEELDLSGWDASNVTTMLSMFDGIDSLRTIKTPKNISNTVDISGITTSDLWDISDNNTVYTAGTFPVGNGNASHTLSFVGPDGFSEMIYWEVDRGSNTLFITDHDFGCPYMTMKSCGSFRYDETFVSVGCAGKQTPWIEKGERDNIKNIVVNGNVAPTNTNSWFNGLWDVKNVDVSGLNTSRVTSMSYMFSECGEYAETFDVVGLENWDTSKVINMSYMFRLAGWQSTTWDIGDISNWDTSKVINMEGMFVNAGMYAEKVELDLINWSTSSLIDRGTDHMFCNTGYNGDTTIKGIDKFRAYTPIDIRECPVQ